MGNLFFKVSYISDLAGERSYSDPEVVVIETGWVARCSTSPTTCIELRWRFTGFKESGNTRCGWEPTCDGFSFKKAEGLTASWGMLKPALRWQIEQKLLREFEGRGRFLPNVNEQSVLDEGGYMWPSHRDSFGTIIWRYQPVR